MRAPEAVTGARPSGDSLLSSTRQPQPGERVVVALSGGVDSSVAAGLLVERGCEVIGVTLSLVAEAAPHAGACCTPEDVVDARRVCAQLGIRHYVLNEREAFKQAVIDPFVAAYRAGETPNPCAACNQVLKFDRLLRRAVELESRWLVTGHYARIRQLPDGSLRLLQGRDPKKDQSYFLYGIRPEALQSLAFPVGELTKDEVRSEAARMGLRTSGKPDSQDVCFVGPRGVGAFVEGQGGASPAGDVVDAEGRVVGRHGGVHGYTVGQRKGLGIAGPEPLYVRHIDAARRRLVVTTRARLQVPSVEVRDWAWLRRPEPGEPCAVRIRHGMHPAPVAHWSQDELLRLRLREPIDAPAPGQAAVLYGGPQQQEVLGGGTLVAAAMR